MNVIRRAQVSAILALIALTSAPGCDRDRRRSQPTDEPAPPQPTTAPEPPPLGGSVTPPVAGCGPMRVELGHDAIAIEPGVWPTVVARGDRAALTATLQVHRKGCASRAVELVPDGTVAYRDVIETMDVLIAAGFPQVSLDAGDPTPPPTPPTPRRPPPGSDPPRPDRAALAKAPVIVVTRTDLAIGGTRLALTTPDLEAAVTRALRALPPDPAAPPGTLILQADQDTAGPVINDIVRATKNAGYDNLLFAVQRK